MKLPLFSKKEFMQQADNLKNLLTIENTVTLAKGPLESTAYSVYKAEQIEHFTQSIHRIYHDDDIRTIIREINDALILNLKLQQARSLQSKERIAALKGKLLETLDKKGVRETCH